MSQVGTDNFVTWLGMNIDGNLVGLGSVGWRNLFLAPCTTFWFQDLTLFFQKSAYVEKGNYKAYEKAGFLYQEEVIWPLFRLWKLLEPQPLEECRRTGLLLPGLVF